MWTSLHKFLRINCQIKSEEFKLLCHFSFLSCCLFFYSILLVLYYGFFINSSNSKIHRKWPKYVKELQSWILVNFMFLSIPQCIIMWNYFEWRNCRLLCLISESRKANYWLNLYNGWRNRLLYLVINIYVVAVLEGIFYLLY